jgi:hypothetical protein
MHSAGVSTRALALTAALLVVPSGAARAEGPPQVLLAETPGVRPHLCDALQIQLSGVAELRCERAPAQGDLTARIAELSALVSQQRATIAAFVVEERGAGTVQLVIVGARPDRAVLAFEPLRDVPAPDVDRSLSLDVADTLDAVTRAEASRARGPDAPPPPLGAALAAPAPFATPAAAYALLLEAGGAYGAAGSLPFAGLVAVGLRSTRARRALELVASFALGSRARSETDVGEVELRGLAGGLSGRILWRAGPLELGCHGGLGLVRSRASGVSRSGERGTGHVLSAQLELGPDLRLALGQSAYLALAPSLWITPVAQRFALEGEVVRELGHVGVSIPLSLGVRTP